MIAAVIVVLDEAADVGFEIAWQVVVFEQDAVLQGLMPALDLTLGLRMMRRTANISPFAVTLFLTPGEQFKSSRRRPSS